MDVKPAKCACYHCVSFIFGSWARAEKNQSSALASFAAGVTGAGLDGAVVIADWLDLRHRVSLTHGWPHGA
jgi:hypothetical protein